MRPFWYCVASGLMLLAVVFMVSWEGQWVVILRRAERAQTLSNQVLAHVVAETDVQTRQLNEMVKAMNDQVEAIQTMVEELKYLSVELHGWEAPIAKAKPKS